MNSLDVSEQFCLTDDGWSLQLRRTICRETFDKRKRPVLVVPGYGMNAYALRFETRGKSMTRSLSQAGFEVWTVNLRGQGKTSRTRSNALTPSLRRCAMTDVGTAVAHVLRMSQTYSPDVVLVGCSLGGTLGHIYLSLASEPRVGALVTIGSPVQWTVAPRWMRLAFSSERLVGSFPVAGTRTAARLAVPLAKRLPKLLKLYANSKRHDLTKLKQLTETIDDPHPQINREIARWMKDKDLVIGGINISQKLVEQRIPVLAFFANKDGIVPPENATPLEALWGGPAQLIEVGTNEDWYAHADLFVGYDAPRAVFDPMVDWLSKQA